MAKVLLCRAMARRPDKREPEVSAEDLKELRYSPAHLSQPAVREFYERAYQDCRLIYNRLRDGATPLPGLTVYHRQAC